MTLRPDIDINGINEALITKADLAFSNVVIGNKFKQLLLGANIKYVKETYSSGTSWYRIWNDGYIEQGGITNYMSWTGNGATVNITFLKPMSNTNYHRGATMLDFTANWNTPGCCVNSCNTSGMVVGVATLGNNQGTTRCSWYACGY